MEPRRRRHMESQFGPPGSGARSLAVGGRCYTLAEVMTRLGLAFEECRALDGLELGPARFMIRYYDAQEQWVVAYEFDDEFRYLGETRAHIAEWVGEDGLALGGVPDAIEMLWTSR